EPLDFVAKPVPPVVLQRALNAASASAARPILAPVGNGTLLVHIRSSQAEAQLTSAAQGGCRDRFHLDRSRWADSRHHRALYSPGSKQSERVCPDSRVGDSRRVR